MAGSPSETGKTRHISRRDFIFSIIPAVVGGIALANQAPFLTEAAAAKELDPHTLIPLYSWGAMTGLLVDSQGRLQRSVEPPQNIQNALQDQLKVFVPWTGRDPRKPDAPGGVCDFTTPNGDHVETKLVYKQEIMFEVVDEKPPKIETVDIRTLVPFFDSHTGNTLITDANGTILRVSPPPDYQQGLADGKYTTVIPYHMRGKVGNFDIPWGDCVTTTPDGRKTTKDLQYPKSLRVTK